MKSILNATGMGDTWPQQKVDQGNRPAYAVKGAFNQARVRPDWAAKSDPRPLFPKNASGPYADPFPILTGAAFDASRFQKAPRNVLQAYYHKEANT